MPVQTPRLITLALFAAVFVTLVSCEKPTPVEYAQACSEANDQKLIQTSGYLTDGGSLFCSNTRDNSTVECGFQLLAKIGDKNALKVDIAVGNGANSVEKIERGYKPSDLKIHDHAGALINFSKPVTITARARAWHDPTSKEKLNCYFTVKKLEQM
ncbi:MAG: hypothetical protein AB7I41_01470 [Candidatus Sericytochromatia bacterium]